MRDTVQNFNLVCDKCSLLATRKKLENDLKLFSESLEQKTKKKLSNQNQIQILNNNLEFINQIITNGDYEADIVLVN